MLVVPGLREVVVRLRFLPFDDTSVLATALERDGEAGQPRQALECRFEALARHRSGYRCQREILQQRCEDRVSAKVESGSNWQRVSCECRRWPARDATCAPRRALRSMSQNRRGNGFKPARRLQHNAFGQTCMSQSI